MILWWHHLTSRRVLVRVLDRLWTSHTDKQQPRRQHLSWKEKWCCLLWVLLLLGNHSSTYVFRAIFDWYGNILYLRGACGKQAMCCRNHIAKMALPFWLKLGTCTWRNLNPPSTPYGAGDTPTGHPSRDQGWCGEASPISQDLIHT